MDRKEIKTLFDKFSDLHVVVVGDVMLDSYWWGDVERISPEAPVPIVALQQRENRLGGAANVALNCVSLGAKVTLASVVGDDEQGNILCELAEKSGIETSLICRSKYRPTTTKTRIISRNQQILRLDDETDQVLTIEEEHPFLDKVLRFLQIEKPDILIFEDYDKGLLKENIIHRIIAHCRETGTLTAVDPKKRNFSSYHGVTIFKPNLKEIREGLHISLDPVNMDTLHTADQQLRSTLNHQISLITLSEKGIYFNDGNSSGIVPAYVRDIADVSGAGDTVIAVTAMWYLLTKNLRDTAILANIAGGLVCGQVGVVPVKRQELQDAYINARHPEQSSE